LPDEGISFYEQVNGERSPDERRILVKGVVLAGGTGTRLLPLTKIVNKHLLPVGKYPMIHYALDKLSKAGVRDVMIVTGKQSAGLFVDYIGSGAEWGIRTTYRIQDEAGGIAQALALAEDFIHHPEEKFVVLLGDNLFGDDLSPYLEQFALQERGAMVLLKAMVDPGRYGVPVFERDLITHIVEKPEYPPSQFCVTGIYMYDRSVFDIIRTIRPSGRGELEITDVNNIYAAQGDLSYRILQGWWTDAGTHESLAEAARHIREESGRCESF
jgi:glucose-1-phosphate thymidylyltransferase